MADKVFLIYKAGDLVDVPEPPPPQGGDPIPPSVPDGSDTVASGATAPLDLLGAATAGDFAIDLTSLEIVTDPAVGTLVPDVDGTADYTAPDDFGGTVPFTFRVADVEGNFSADAEFVVTVTAPPPVPPPYPNGYEAAMEFRVPSAFVDGGAAMPNFLMLVDVTHASLRLVANGGLVKHASGFDMRWQSPAGALLPFHRLSWDEPTGRAKFIVRVQVNGASDTSRFLFVGKAGLVASEEDLAATYSGYYTVWNGRTGVDLTGNARHLTPANVGNGADIWADAGDYNGTTSAMTAVLTGWGGATAVTVQSLIDRDVTGQTRGHVKKGPALGAATVMDIATYDRPQNAAGTVNNPVLGNIKTSTGAAYFVSVTQQQSTDPSWETMTWVSGEAPRMFNYGVEIEASSSQVSGGTNTDDGSAWFIGDAPSTAQFPKAGPFDGRVEQVRTIKGTALTPDFLGTEGRNYADPEMFYGRGGAFDPAGVNRSPVARPYTVSVLEGGELTIAALAAAYDPDGDVLVLDSVSSPAHGSAVINGGNIIYTPTPGYFGADTFTYTVEDTGTATSTARVRVTVVEVVDPPAGDELPTPLRIVNVNTNATLTAALAAALPGDEIRLADAGTYNAAQNMTKSGTAANPIVITGVTPLGPTISGGVWDYKDENWIITHGLNFTGDVSNRIVASGFDNIIRRCDFSGWRGQAIRPYNGHDGKALGGRWTVDYCDFHDPAPFDEPPGGPEPSRVAIRARSNSVANFPYNWTIRRCHFYDLPAKAGAPAYYGQSDAMEWAGDGSSHPNLNNAGWLLEYILVENHLGRDAVIDIKSGGSVLRYVTILDCPNGRMDNRYWDGNTFEGTWFENCSGMDIHGRNHVINGVKMINGPLGNPHIYVQSGNNLSGATGPGNPQYQQVQDVTIIAQDGGVVAVGYRYITSSSNPDNITDLPPLRTRLEAKVAGTTKTKTGVGGTTVDASLLDGTGANLTVVTGTPSRTIVTPIKVTTALAGTTAAWQD